MRRLIALLVGSVLLLALVVGASPASAGTGCPSGEVRVKGRVTDRATGLPLSEVTSVEFAPLGTGTPADGAGTNAASRWSMCLLPDDYLFTFRADSYRVDAHAMAEVTVALPGPVVLATALTPQGRVLAGRVTNMVGAPRFASISIWRRTPGGRWRAIDGEGNDPGTGIWSYRVPTYGRYRVNAAVDHYWARWHRSETRLRFARTLVVGPDTTFIRNVDIRVPYCPGPTDDFCIPPGFNS